ncbi:hypothetical protein CK203_029215 [Vitis vinifera]|uniref:Uncharacterized protein n=1 Tax=Vitis vinifera TaxID=29760 RepID=A0A438ISV7_VITVI|nr:hypothetical protein CK203_029215 [Vitis vinifera]
MLVFVGKYKEEEGGWCSKASREGYRADLWKAIWNGWKEFNKKVGFRVGNEAKVGQMWEQVRKGDCWNPMFTRQINDWQLREVEELLSRLQGQVIKRGVEVVMRLTKRGTFTMKSFYSSLAAPSIVWNPLVPMTVSFVT